MHSCRWPAAAVRGPFVQSSDKSLATSALANGRLFLKWRLSLHCWLAPWLASCPAAALSLSGLAGLLRASGGEKARHHCHHVVIIIIHVAACIAATSCLLRRGGQPSKRASGRGEGGRRQARARARALQSKLLLSCHMLLIRDMTPKHRLPSKKM